MKKCNYLVKLAICLVLVLTTTFCVNPHKAEAQAIADCQKIVAGTYLTTTNSDVFGSFRGISTYTQQGNVFFSASNQGGSSANPPYGIIQGSWKCTSDREITGVGVNFNYPTEKFPNSIGRSDFRATFNPQAETVQATVTVRRFDLNANPLKDDGLVLGTFTFTGQRVKPDVIDKTDIS
ncbi:hypothetical protein [Iningainema tapete]|uniref:Uncharacterized protein n=1 Tax=Iningainema tapete BLCC-T55 TaxID=2748662 RepID=A0A8J7BZK1_9CYAN|nr:hypothetical protein [Iningainema tapete]MBD2776073.1 hypothetical protein [Iningainema tapete BLCC-T55]